MKKQSITKIRLIYNIISMIAMQILSVLIMARGIMANSPAIVLSAFPIWAWAMMIAATQKD